jgi:hypothetical protein
MLAFSPGDRMNEIVFRRQSESGRNDSGGVIAFAPLAVQIFPDRPL